MGETEEARGNRAKGALESISPDDPKFVESGLERVSDGAHSRPSLEKGKAYKVSLACVGTGTVKVVIGEKTPQSLPCDGISMSHDVRNSAEESPMDVTAAPGATGMVAWQIIAVSS
ncbi:hypothetical protein [Streptomyces sp. NPDC031705]|uniref:hypothetical protein n=1 Tax=Streptomyces sp. NPDC031705 TaxID=3155729 RepID=UPI0033CDC7E3